jgi:predicted O-methyltransferase YrrM
MQVADIYQQLTIPASDRCTSVRQAEGQFMHDLVRKHGLSRTLEVGLAYGASAACIMSAHAGRHTCMDPFQHEYDQLGLKNLASLGFGDRLDFHAGFSHAVLPRLNDEQNRYDFAFIDGSHLYDGIFLDFFYVDLLLAQQGFVVLHDAWMRSTQMVASFVKKNRRDYRLVKTPAWNLIVFRKSGQDERPWYHFREFYTSKSVLKFNVMAWAIKRGGLLPVATAESADQS